MVECFMESTEIGKVGDVDSTTTRLEVVSKSGWPN